MSIPFTFLRCRSVDSDLDGVRLAAYVGRAAPARSAVHRPYRLASFGAPAVYAATLPTAGVLPPAALSGRDDFDDRTANVQVPNLHRAVLSCLPSRLSRDECWRLVRDWIQHRYAPRGLPDPSVVQVTHVGAGQWHAHLICLRRG